MADQQDIRQWARDQGMDVKDRGPISPGVMERWRAEQAAAGDEPDGAPGPPPVITGDVTPDGDGPASRPPIPGLADRLKARRKKKSSPGTRPRRVSIEGVVGGVYSVGAMAMVRNPSMLPLARCLDMQAPVAGIVADDVFKGTIIDRMLQPLARAGEAGEKAGALFGLPLTVTILTRYPNLYPVVKPVGCLMLMQWMEISGPAMKKAAERQARFAERFGELDVGSMFDALFAPPEPAGPYSPDEEEAIRRARGDGAG